MARTGTRYWSTLCVSSCTPLSQTIITLIPGDSYVFGFWASETTSFFGLKVMIGQTVLFENAQVTQPTWTFFYTYFQAAVSMAVLSFDGQGAFKIDDIFLSRIESPTSLPSSLPSSLPTAR
jgi:hypothetical protein